MKKLLDIMKLVGTGLMMTVAAVAYPQSNKGTITPVESDDNAPPKPILHYYDKHGDKLETPVLYLAELDTASAVRPSSPYPLYNGVSIGANFGDAIMTLIGQKHQSYDISAMVSLHNWFFPVVEAGIGWGNYHDNNDLYRIKAYPSFYAKVGINYNFLYKSDPAYMAYIGLRACAAHPRWDKTDIKSINEDGITITSPDQLNKSCLSVYGEVVAGLKVKIAGPFSLGWNVRYRVVKKNKGGADPWFVPGYGTGPLGVNISAYFTFGEKKKKDLTDLLPEHPADNTTSPTAEPSTSTSGPASPESPSESSSATSPESSPIGM